MEDFWINCMILSLIHICYYDPVTHRFVNADGYFQSGDRGDRIVTFLTTVVTS